MTETPQTPQTPQTPPPSCAAPFREMLCYTANYLYNFAVILALDCIIYMRRLSRDINYFVDMVLYTVAHIQFCTTHASRSEVWRPQPEDFARNIRAFSARGELTRELRLFWKYSDTQTITRFTEENGIEELTITAVIAGIPLDVRFISASGVYSAYTTRRTDYLYSGRLLFKKFERDDVIEILARSYKIAREIRYDNTRES